MSAKQGENEPKPKAEARKGKPKRVHGVLLLCGAIAAFAAGFAVVWWW